MNSKIRALFYLTLVLFAHGGTVSGQVAAENDVRSEIRLLREQMAQLGQRLLELELRTSGDSDNSGPSVVQDRIVPIADAEPVPEAQAAKEAPMDLSGFFASRLIRTGLGGEAAGYQVHSASLFFGKTLGNWSFHSEMEFDYQPSLENGAIPVLPSKGEVELETAWLNYKKRDWLNVRAGILMLPTYWRLHSYQATTMTAQAPLIYETVFPPNVTGVMIHGSKYFEDNGFTYSVYAGQGREFLSTHDNSRGAAGASFVVHLPSRHWLNTFDIGVHHYRDRIDLGRRSIWGLESRIERNRFAWLSEVARSGIGSGRGRELASGYYLQPSMRLAGQFFGLYRYDRLHAEGTQLRFQRHTIGVLYRPVPEVALKFEWNRYPAEGLSPARNGVAAGVSIFVR